MSDASPGRVFISYRRQDARSSAGRIYDRLADRFGDDQVFMDVDTIALGVDFTKVITQAVSTCQVLLAVIGPHWLDAKDENGRRRLDDPDDLVRLEIAAALERDIIVIPILVEGAAMPRRQQLPRKLAGLAPRNALSLRHESFRTDTDKLMAAIEPILRAAVHTPVSSVPTRAVPGAVQATDLVAKPIVVQEVQHNSTVNGVAFSPDGRLLATASDDRTAGVWEVASGQEILRVDHNTRVWGVPAGQERPRVTRNYRVFGVAFSPDGRLLATASEDESARVWEVANGDEFLLVRLDGWIFGVAFHPDGRLLATASDDRTARVWELPSGQERTQLDHDPDLDHLGWAVNTVAFSPDGRLLATASDDESARVWDWASGQEVVRLDHYAKVKGVAFSPDGQLLATASEDESARVWDWASGQEVVRVDHGNTVNEVAFSPDGQLLATASDDRTARVWEVAGGQEVVRLDHQGRVKGVAFSPDGQLLATASDSTARIWMLGR